MADTTVYDIVFAGAGTTACLVAGRLIKADPSLKILLIENGPHTQEDLAHVQPARYPAHLAPDSKTVRFVEGKPSAALGGRSIVVPAGQCVGGGSSVNFTMYTRAAASDYDDWETKYNNKGWGSKELIPLLKKTETYQVQPDLDSHGYEGPIKVSYGGKLSNIGEDYLEVASNYDPTRKATHDVNGIFTCNEYGRWPKWIDEKTGKRSDTAHHFLYNNIDNQNQKAITGCAVKRVIFEGNRAVGVEYVKNPAFHPGASPEEVFSVRAGRLVSGIGATPLLEKLGVHTVVDLPGVGARYQDHYGVFPAYFASDESDTLDWIVRSDPDELKKWTEQWLKDGSGLMATNGLDAGIKIRPNAEELADIGPAFQKRWNEFFANAPDKPVLWLGLLSGLFGDHTIAPPRKFFAFVSFIMHPSSTGYVHISSGTDPLAPPDFDPGYLTAPDDAELLAWAWKYTREFARRMKCYRGAYSVIQPKIPASSEAACKEDDLPVDIDAPKLKYTEEDEEAIRKFVRDEVHTTWHSLGTCPMKPRSQNGVVDSNLNVYGVKGLKVADMSIAPGNVASNTYSTALVIGEKAAVIIAEELGIKGV
ncbi:alcohol oxidase [Panus rudis PR-1116 ss-1]|nr:alcohol oxidase [Panus rudis PR-1116 ss-1]